jgi:hypothetical protein
MEVPSPAEKVTREMYIRTTLEPAEVEALRALGNDTVQTVESVSSHTKPVCYKRVPLDGSSQRARLINLHCFFDEHAVGRIPGEFYSRLHLPNSVLTRTNDSSRRALFHWFLRGECMYEVASQDRYQGTAPIRYLDALAQCGFDVIGEAERCWDDDQPKRHSLDGAEDGYWTSEVNEIFEPRTTKKRVRGITQRH